MQHVPLAVLLEVEEVRSGGCQLLTLLVALLPWELPPHKLVWSCKRHANAELSSRLSPSVRGAASKACILAALPVAAGLCWCPASGLPMQLSGLPWATGHNQVCTAGPRGAGACPPPQKGSLPKRPSSDCDEQPVLAWLFDLAPILQEDCIFILTRLLRFPRQSNAYKQWTNKTLDKDVSLQFPHSAKYYLLWGNSVGRTYSKKLNPEKMIWKLQV